MLVIIIISKKLNSKENQARLEFHLNSLLERTKEDNAIRKLSPADTAAELQGIHFTNT